MMEHQKEMKRARNKYVKSNVIIIVLQTGKKLNNE